MHTTNPGDRHPGENDDHPHLQDELKQISDQHSAQSSKRRIKPRERDQNEDAEEQRCMAGSAERVICQEMDDAPLRDHGAKQHRNDAHHGIGDPAQDQAIHNQAEIDGFESAEECGWPAGIPDFSQLHIGQDFSAPPVAREEEHGEHSAEAGTPPDPVTGDALSGHHASDEQWSISGKGGGHHRGACQPP